MAKQIYFNEEARRALKRGVDMVADAVKTTLGPRGRNVAIDKKFGSPTVTHDGVTVAKEIELEDPIREHGRPACSRKPPPRPTTSPVTAPLRQPCWPSRSLPKA
jgi:hypothetical protein